MTVRVYLPVTSSDLAVLAAEGRLAGPRAAHAVTEALRVAWPEADEDTWEFAAMLAAGEDSWAARTAADQPRRVVIAADVPAMSAATDPEAAPTQVQVPTDIVLKRIAAFHLDTADIEGEPDFDEELAWFATQELSHLL